jgi:hypothetical protein
MFSFHGPDWGKRSISKPTIFLGLLIALQTVLLVILFFRLGSFDDRLDGLMQAAGQISEVSPAVVETTDHEQAGPAPGIDSLQVRQIVREELRAALDDSSRVAQDSSTEFDQPVYDNVEMQQRQEWILDQIDLLKQQDSVSSMELDRVMAAIARLDPERRTEMLRELNRAINKGEIKGHF